MKKKIVYEQPLNEHVRNLLRLEYLFAGIAYYVKGPAEWDSRAVIRYVIDILEFIARFDVKAELIKELEYHAQILERWQNTPKVDTERVVQLLNKAQALLKYFKEDSESLADLFLQHHLINSVRQRSNIYGGHCRCDLPGYYFWLQKNPKQRQSELNDWLTGLEPLREAVELNLYLMRNNTIVSQETATAGLFQSSLEATTTYRLIQVVLPSEQGCYPEISGGKQRFTIRFFEQSHIEQSPLQTAQDIPFDLYCCVM